MFKRALEYWQIYGTKALIHRIIFGSWRLSTGNSRELQSSGSASEVIKEQFPDLSALPVFSSPAPAKRINLVTDSINGGSLFGGVATAIIFATLLANKMKCSIRLITRSERAIKSNFFKILNAHGLACDKNVDFTYVKNQRSKVKLDVSDEDIFVTTSWWTTESALRSIREENIIYLLQEDERMFYPFGDEHLRCCEVLKNEKIRFIINSKLLYDHFLSEGFDNIQKTGTWFEPSFDKALLFKDSHKSIGTAKKKFFFYARPRIHLRNLFYRGIEVIEAAVLRGILNPDDWELHFVGNCDHKLIIGNLCKPIIHRNLEWRDYCKLIRSMDLGLSLMYTPHPSYPPLDLAVSGAVVVTNRYGVKQDLSQYSKNIICTDTDLESLLGGLTDGVQLAFDQEARDKNYEANNICRDWVVSFKDVMTWLINGDGNVQV